MRFASSIRVGHDEVLRRAFGNAVIAGGFLYEAAHVTANLWKLTAPQDR
jgi:hypothetical protein